MRTVIVAESRAAADAVRQGLRFASGITVIGYADGRTPCAGSVAAATPELVVVADLADRDATLACVEQLRAELPAAKVVLFTDDMDTAWLHSAASAGVDAAISTTVGASGLGPLL